MCFFRLPALGVEYSQKSHTSPWNNQFYDNSTFTFNQHTSDIFSLSTISNAMNTSRKNDFNYLPNVQLNVAQPASEFDNSSNGNFGQ